jgi:regulator of sirC expression with transglutaminase-like and TPR domain
MAGPEAEIPLDEAMLLIAARARPDLDAGAALEALDRLAEGCPAPTLDHLVRHLFVDLGFAGNRDDYYDARNSYLDQVVARRLGIPISLSVLAIVVGRRIGVPLAGVAMPGHFLLRDKVDPRVFVDPFAAGARLDTAGCAAVFGRLHGPSARFDERFLEPVGPRAILARVLANLKAIHESAGDRRALVGVLQFRVAIPGVGVDERRELAAALAAAGQFAAAADELEAVAAAAAAATGGDGDDRAEADLTAATRYRARLN